MTDNKQPALQGITVQSAAFSSSSGNLPELTPQEEPSPQSLPSLSGTVEASGQRACAACWRWCDPALALALSFSGARDGGYVPELHSVQSSFNE